MSATAASPVEQRTLTLAPEGPGLPDELRRRLSERVITVGERATMEVRSPFTGEVIGSVPACTPDDVAEAAALAREAQQLWRRTSFAERARVMRRFRDLLLDRQDEVLDLIQLESGKVRGHAFEEVADTAIVAAYYARTARKHLAPQRREGALPLLTHTTEIRHPRGVVGFIAPWNYPLSMAITDAIPALMAGNGAVIKPASQTPFTALWVVERLYEAGIPANLVTVVTGSGSKLGEPIIDAVDFVTFTGSTEVGRTVARRAGERLIGCALELGGKNALLVLDDADLDKAVEGAVHGGFASAGQLCISIERVFVPTDLHDDFVARLVEKVEALELSAELAYGGDMGSLVSQDQLDTTRDHVEDAREKGATVLTGGATREDVGPLFYAPTVLSGVTRSMTAFDHETFGPVVSVYAYDDLDQAIDRINDSDYGLNASIFTSDGARGRDIGARVEAGTVNVNEAYAAAWASVDAPMGGFKDSGLGRRHGVEGIHKYTEVQTVAGQRLMPVIGIPGLDDAQVAKVFTVALKVLHRIPGLRRP